MCFRNIPGYDGRYQINEKGDVKSVEADCVVRNIKRRDGKINEKEIWHIVWFSQKKPMNKCRN